MREVLSRAALVLLAGACSDAGQGLSDDATLLGKCAFTDGNREHIEPGDIYLYLVTASGELEVATGTADVRDPLTDDVPRQRDVTRYPAVEVSSTRIEYGTHFIGIGSRDGTVHVSIGTAEGTDRAYPLCAFWAP